MLNFLKYYDGARPSKSPAKKRPPTDEVKSSEKRSNYERPDRTFNPSWKNGRSWLTFADGKMTCNICIKHNANKNSMRPSSEQNFISGSANLRKSAVTDHELSSGHIRSVEFFKAQSSSSDEIAFSKAGRALKRLKSADKTKMTYLFRNAHAVALKNRPLSDFKWLCELDKVKSLEIGDTYLNDRAALNFIDVIAATQQDEVIRNLEHTPFFSFMMDGSTDISGDEQESMYVRSCHKGIVTENFLNIGSPNSTCSSDLYMYVTSILESTGLHSIAKDKLVGMGSDGASNMIGSKTGLATRLKEDFPEMVSVHCLCHRLELAFRDVFRKAALYDKCMTLLIGLHYFYLKPKQKTGLVHTMKSLGISGLLPPKVTGTRWLPHLARGLTAFFRSYPALVAHLSTASHGNAKAEGLANMVLDRHLVAFMLFLQSLLVPLQKLSLLLQRSSATLSDVLIWTEATTEMLQDCKESQCKDLLEVLEQGRYHNVTLRGSCPTMSYKSDLVDKTMKAIEDRFAMQHSESADIFAATKIACLRSWPSVEDSQEFGDSDISVIFQQFNKTLTSAGITKEVVYQEWRLLKKILYKRFGSDLPHQKWRDIHRQHSEQFQEILVLMDLLHSLPPTSVSCETSFSQMKLIKTSRRCRMRASTLNTLMTVRLHAPSITDFDPEKAIDRWLVTPTRARRLHYHRSKQSQSAVQTSELICVCDENDNSEKDVEDTEEQEEEESDIEEEIAAFNKAIHPDEDSDYCSDYIDEEQTFAKIMNFE